MIQRRVTNKLLLGKMTHSTTTYNLCEGHAATILAKHCQASCYKRELCFTKAFASMAFRLQHSFSTRRATVVVRCQKKQRTLVIQRHGITEMNAYLTRVPYLSPGFRDPGYFDTRLTEDGINGAKKAAKIAKAIHPQPEVLVVSPLTRAMQTARITWAHYNGPVMVEALARERVWLSSDCGRSPEELQVEFPTFVNGQPLQWDHLPDVWWWSEKPDDAKHVSLEREDVFQDRVGDLRLWLARRPESVIGMVAHWGLISELTGENFANSEIRVFDMDEHGHIVAAEPERMRQLAVRV